jgi:hypothetical protein
MKPKAKSRTKDLSPHRNIPGLTSSAISDIRPPAGSAYRSCSRITSPFGSRRPKPPRIRHPTPPTTSPHVDSRPTP